jgi:hypothetical protein
VKLSAGLLILAALAAGACSANPPAADTGLAKLIAELAAAPLANPPHRILRYRYEGNTVYYVPATCCDQPSELLDEQGQVICRPDGGFSGRGDGRCPGFHAGKSDETLIWSDPRGDDTPDAPARPSDHP